MQAYFIGLEIDSRNTTIITTFYVIFVLFSLSINEKRLTAKGRAFHKIVLDKPGLFFVFEANFKARGQARSTSSVEKNLMARKRKWPKGVLEY